MRQVDAQHFLSPFLRGEILYDFWLRDRQRTNQFDTPCIREFQWVLPSPSLGVTNGFYRGSFNPPPALLELQTTSKIFTLKISKYIFIWRLPVL